MTEGPDLVMAELGWVEIVDGVLRLHVNDTPEEDHDHFHSAVRWALQTGRSHLPGSTATVILLPDKTLPRSAADGRLRFSPEDPLVRDLLHRSSAVALAVWLGDGAPAEFVGTAVAVDPSLGGEGPRVLAGLALARAVEIVTPHGTLHITRPPEGFPLEVESCEP